VSGADLLARIGAAAERLRKQRSKGWAIRGLASAERRNRWASTPMFFSTSTVSTGPWMSRSQRRVWTLADRSPKEHNARRLPREGKSACVPDRSDLLVVAVTAVGFAT